MKFHILLLFLFTFIKADELYVTAYIFSSHFIDRDGSEEKFNEKHDAYGLEYITDNKYSLTYNHFTNSRDKEVDVAGVGYLFELNKSFGLQLIGGYQKGYCFSALKSVECQDNSNDTSIIILPLLYYKNKYIKLDFLTTTEMFGLRFNIKIY
ncbi:hypothetical protein HUE87_05170 [Candidatus Sulfurimonas marisnigri]|uniref:Outer membrane protein beta-barrel domain-containing protein n=1 Tax=Candidatus Sulfurimonas marisnigri TaxID=2740405 RepID=A0A7S7RRD4_9BACT|nr:hypothetical protein [Candidatus Sulfurimonas marisnigri]QOY55619.1 hypothetical protein HUE87_05170 [Candidatus Sulfurimonas marisnigri]